MSTTTNDQVAIINNEPLFDCDPTGGDPAHCNSKPIKLQRKLGRLHGFSLIIGLILGSGVFVSPGLVAKDTSSTGMQLIMWVAGGIIALLGALCYCEIACMFKMAGGSYANIFNIYGSMAAFLTAWVNCLVIDPSSIAATALTIGTYVVKPFYETDSNGEKVAKLIAFGLIVLVFIINSFSAKVTNMIQRVLSVIQISSVAFVIIIGIWQLIENKTGNFDHPFSGTVFNKHSPLHFGIALFGALWSYDGWASMTSVVEELDNVEQNLVLTLITGIPFVMFCYIMANISFLAVLSHQQIGATDTVAIDFIDKVLGVKTSYLMMVLVALSAFGNLNGSFFTAPRTTMSAGREGHMPFIFSLLYHKNEQPIPASVLLMVVSSLMLLPETSNLNTLILLFSQAQWILYTASTIGVIILRYRRPDIDRPFKVFLGIPVFFSIIGVYLVIIPFFRYFWLSIGMFGFIALGMPIYLLCVKYLPSCCSNFMEICNMKFQVYFGFVPCSKGT
eukprot:TCONS_00030265-protein